MLPQVAAPLAIPISSPFPVTLALGAIGLVAFGAELALARRGGQAHRRLLAPLVGCMVIAAMLVVWGAYFTVSQPSQAEPVFHLSGAGNPTYDLYRVVWEVNVLIALLMAIVAFAIGATLLNQRRRHLVSAPA